jgi:hypothetical protein
MPKQPIIPIWGGLNTANSPSATGLLDPVTNQQYNTGGLNRGDYFDLTEQEANTLSNTTVGLCHAGRYRYVQLDSGATVAYVKTGLVGYIRAGTFVQSVAITSAGSGQTQGVYTVAATVGSGGGAGAVIQVVVGSAGTVTSATVLNGGFGYISVPTFTLVTGGSVGTVAAQLNSTPNTVTSEDQVGTTGIAVRPVVFLNALNNWAPGNYAFIQELGLATVLGNATIGAGNSPGGFVNVASSGAGTVNTTAASGSPIGSTIGVAIDTPLASNLFKIYMQYVPVVQD